MEELTSQDRSRIAEILQKISPGKPHYRWMTNSDSATTIALASETLKSDHLVTIRRQGNIVAFAALETKEDPSALNVSQNIFTERYGISLGKRLWFAYQLYRHSHVRRNPETLHIDIFALDQEYSLEDVGQELLEKTIDLARSIGKTTLVIENINNDSELYTFCTEHGFTGQGFRFIKVPIIRGLARKAGFRG